MLIETVVWMGRDWIALVRSDGFATPRKDIGCIFSAVASRSEASYMRDIPVVIEYIERLVSFIAMTTRPLLIFGSGLTGRSSQPQCKPIGMKPHETRDDLGRRQGRRMRPLTADKPKPLIEVSGKLLLAFHLERLVAEVLDIVVNASYHAQQIVDYCGDAPGGLSHQCDCRANSLETVGGILNAIFVAMGRCSG